MAFKTRKNKYNATRVRIGEKTFDSKIETKIYLILKSFPFNDVTQGVTRMLIPKQTTASGRPMLAVKYTPDVEIHHGLHSYIIDVKSVVTRRKEDHIIRAKLMHQIYGIELIYLYSAKEAIWFQDMVINHLWSPEQIIQEQLRQEKIKRAIKRAMNAQASKTLESND